MERRSHRVRPVRDFHAAAKTWRSRSGRTEGPDEYVVGDIVSSVFLRTRTMTQRERQELYGCPVLLVGVYSAHGFADVTPSTKFYVSLRTSDKDGNELPTGNLISHCALPSTDASRPPGTFDFDDVLTLGTLGDLGDVDRLTVRVKQFPGAFAKKKLLGEVKVSLQQLFAEAGPNSPPFESVFDVGAPASAATPGATVGALHLRFFLHFPPPDPIPCAVHVTIAEGRSLLPRDVTGQSDPYVRVRPVVLRGGRQGVKDAWGRAAEYRTTTQLQTLNPTWPDHVTFVSHDLPTGLGKRLVAADESGFDWALLEPDGATERTVRAAASEKHAAGAPPHAPGSAAVTRIPCEDLSQASGIELRLLDWDAVTADDDMGEAFLSFSSLFGDEDAVVGSHSLSVRKWVRVAATRALADEGVHVGLGHVLVHVALAFEQPLLPPGWREAVDAETGHEYYFNTRTGASQWEEPPELRAQRVVAPGSGAGAASDSAPSPSPAAAEVTRPSAAAGADAEAPPARSSAPPPPPPRAAKAAEADGSARPGDEADEEGWAEDEEEAEGAAAAAAAAAAERVPIQSAATKAAPAVPEFVNPLGHEARKSMRAGDRDSAFFSHMRAAAESRKQSEEEKLRARLDAMTPEERAEYERERANEERREARKSRMLQSSIGAYASASVHHRGAASAHGRSPIAHRSKSGRRHKVSDGE